MRLAWWATPALSWQHFASVGTFFMTLADPTANRTAVAAAPGLHPIRLETLRRQKTLEFNLFTLGPDGRPVLFRQRNYPLVDEDLQELIESGVETLYVKSADEVHYSHFLRTHIDDILSDGKNSPEVSYDILQEFVLRQLRESMELVDTARCVEQCTETGKRIAALLTRNDLLPSELLRLMRHDYGTFTHVLNVASLATLLARALGVSDQAELEEIATGGLLHDIGKRFLSPLLLNNPGRLSAAEMAIMRRHPRMGFEELCDQPNVTWAQLMMVYQHHETLDGTGYPVRLTEAELHWHARLCTVADVFEALTSERPYRKRWSATAALTYLEEHAGKKFDREMVQCWKKTIHAS